MAVLERERHRHAEWVAVLRAVAIGADPLRRLLVECLEKLARARLVDQAFLLVVEQPLRQRLRVELLVGRREVEGAGLFRRDFRAHCEVFARVGVDRVVDHLARAAEHHWAVRVAVAGRKRIPERHHEQVLDPHVRLDELAAIRQLHIDRNARGCVIKRERHAIDDDFVAARQRALPRLAAGRPRAPAPDTGPGAGIGAALG